MKGYWSYILDEESRSLILEKFPSQHKNEKAHHITIAFDVDANFQLEKKPKLEVIGYCSGLDIDCLIVSVNGKTERPNGGTYYITLSHSDKVEAFHSNEILKNGWIKVNKFSLVAEAHFTAFS